MGSFPIDPNVIFSVNYTCFVVFLLFVDVMMMYRLVKTPGFGEEERWIFKLSAATSICTLFDALCIGIGKAGGPAGNFIFNAVYDVSTVYIAYFFFCFCVNRCGFALLTHKRHHVLVNLPALFLVAIIVSSACTGLIFSVDVDGNYIRGPLFELFVFMADGYLIAAMILLLLRLPYAKTAKEKALFKEFVLYMIPLVAGTVAQTFYVLIPSSSMGLTICLLLIFINNQQRLLERKVIEAQAASQAKSLFLSRISHDVRTPINGILGMLNIIQENPDNVQRVSSCALKAQGAAEQLLSLVRDVLSMSKIESGSVQLADEPFDLADMLQSMDTLYGIVANEQGIEFTAYGTEGFEHRYVQGSPAHVRSVLNNLVSNALKYTEPGGEVICRVEETPLSEACSSYTFTVEDTGIGMSEKFAKHVFEPFAQEKVDARSTYQGTGLGLAIVKQLVDMMGGEVSVKTEQGKGSTFTLVLPLRLASEAQVCREELMPRDISGLRALLVEDNELNLEIAQHVLEEAGVVVTVAHNGKEAVDRFCADAPGSYDVVLMDIMMPVMDGLEAARAIRVSGKDDALDVAIIAMSAKAFQEDIVQAHESGMNAYLVKPVSADKLKDTLAKVRG